MTDLVAIVSSGKGTWTNVLKLMSKSEFENVFLIISPWVKDTLKITREKVTYVIIDEKKSHEEIKESIYSQLKGKIKNFEVAVNIDSGTGKEHTGLITALLKLGLAFRFIIYEDDKIKDLSDNHSHYFKE